MVRILSWDVGIRNLSFCLAEVDENTKDVKIEDWDIINLMDDEINNQQLCSHISKMKPYKPCSKFAKFKLSNDKEYYCKAHKKNYKYSNPIVTKTDDRCKCSVDECTKKTRYIVDDKKVCPSHKCIIEKDFKKNYTLKTVKTINCSKIPLSVIADKMITILDSKFHHLLNCDLVLIELQPCLSAPTMKSVSVCLWMYLRMHGIHYHTNNSNMKECSFFRATNKLEFNENNTVENKSVYKNRKKTGVQNVVEYLDSVNDTTNKEKFISHKKNDDLADALLQILVYTKTKL